MRRFLIPLLVILVGAAAFWQHQSETAVPVQRDVPGRLQAQRGLPAEAWETLALIDRGGPFPYRQDGSEFRNREALLPAAARGYYREYTVPTPGAPDRGARRIITGGTPPSAWYYTSDHYRSFRPVTLVENSAP